MGGIALLHAGIEAPARGCGEQPDPYGLAALRDMTSTDLTRLAHKIAFVQHTRKSSSVPVTMAGRSVPNVVAAVVKIAAAEGNITVDELLSASKHHQHVKPRQRAMASLCALKRGGVKRFSRAQVAVFFRRDRSCITGACRRVPDDMLIEVPE